MLDADVTENFFYRPTTRATHQVYEQLLVVLQQQLGDQPDEVLRGAADEVLQVLKEDGVREGDRKRNIEAVLGPLSQDRFSKLFQLSKNITDFMGADQDREDAGTQSVVEGPALSSYYSLKLQRRQQLLFPVLAVELPQSSTTHQAC